jgi:Kef-type K+ transport system membrane component KefB
VLLVPVTRRPIRSHEHQRSDILLLITLGAYLMPFVSKKLLLPSPVGEMLFGVGVAASGSCRSPGREYRAVSGGTGFVLLMYLAGMEIEIDLLKKRPFRDLAVMGLYYALVLLLSLWVVSGGANR